MRTYLLAGLLAAGGLCASTVTPTSYLMPNGSASGGTSTNWEDTIYLPCPGSACVTSGASLSGGTGKLTNGIISNLSWDQQPIGPSTFVGWSATNPTITFFFSSTVFIDSVSLHMDDALNRGLVYLPSSVTIAGQPFAVAPDNLNGAPRWLTFNNLGLTASSVTITLTRTNTWMMLDEVTFDNTAASAPEPAAMLLVGGGMLLLLRRRLRLAPSARQQALQCRDAGGRKNHGTPEGTTEW